jgi:transcriptional regulator with XRE-family HTH domain
MRYTLRIMTREQLRTIRDRMGLTQAGLAEKLKVARNSVARMESGRMIITPPMALLISFVAREAEVERGRQRASHTGSYEGKRLGSSRYCRKRRRK